MPYWRLNYHLVWATFERIPSIDEECEGIICVTARATARKLRVILHEINGTDDHVHLVVSVPPSLAIAECVRRLKGASSHAVSHRTSAPRQFRWQEGYGAITISPRGLPTVIEYVKDQKAHHRRASTIADLEAVLDSLPQRAKRRLDIRR